MRAGQLREELAHAQSTSTRNRSMRVVCSFQFSPSTM
jgi:hypothetical protein